MDISAQASLPSGLESRHFEIFSCCALSQIQTPSLFHKPRTSIRSTTLLNLIIDKLPVFFSFDGDYVTSLGCTDAPVVTRIPSAFREYVRGVFETGCLALYGKKKNEKINFKKCILLIAIVIIFIPLLILIKNYGYQKPLPH